MYIGHGIVRRVRAVLIEGFVSLNFRTFRIFCFSRFFLFVSRFSKTFFFFPYTGKLSVPDISPFVKCPKFWKHFLFFPSFSCFSWKKKAENLEKTLFNKNRPTSKMYYQKSVLGEVWSFSTIHCKQTQKNDMLTLRLSYYSVIVLLIVPVSTTAKGS